MKHGELRLCLNCAYINSFPTPCRVSPIKAAVCRFDASLTLSEDPLRSAHRALNCLRQWLRSCKDTFPRCPGDSVVTCQPGDSEEKVSAPHTHQAFTGKRRVNSFICALYLSFYFSGF